jgi:hypothetical protein
MSILSSPQGTPERVWSLVGLTAANGSTIDRAEAADLMNPSFIENQQIVRDDSFAQTLGAATSLGALEVDKTSLRLNPTCRANDYITFGDWVHNRLTTLDTAHKDAILLQTYAWIVAESLHQGTISWFHEWTNDAIVDAATKALPEATDDDGSQIINTTKLPPWRRWLVCVGLFVPMPNQIQPHPTADDRLVRELEHSELERDSDISASEFLRFISVQLPYLDSGRLFKEAAGRMEYATNPLQVSPFLSAALRNLHDEDIIELRIRGDASNVVRLSEASHKVQSFSTVVVRKRET